MRGKGKVEWWFWLLANLVKDPFQLINLFSYLKRRLNVLSCKTFNFVVGSGAGFVGLCLLYVFV